MDEEESDDDDEEPRKKRDDDNYKQMRSCMQTKMGRGRGGEGLAVADGAIGSKQKKDHHGSAAV